jgi:predicted small integral membrane protein
MMTRLAKVLLLAAIAFFYSIVVFNNVTDYGSNYQFVHHVLMMDSTFPANHGMWRALNRPLWHHVFYVSIIAWEACTTMLCWIGTIVLARKARAESLAFNRAKMIGIAGLTISLLMWLVAFLSVGGEWFLMWQSKAWNGQEAAARMFTVVGIVLILLISPDVEDQA